MFTRRSAFALPGLLAAIPRIASAWAKGQFWEAKPPAEWSEKEVKDLMTKSPWAKEVAADFQGGMGGGMGGGGGRRGGGGMGGGGMGGPGGGAPSMPQFKALVRWETAGPILQAGKRKWPDSVAGHYLVSVSKLPMMGGGGGGRGMRPPQRFQAVAAPQGPPRTNGSAGAPAHDAAAPEGIHAART